ncbi:hypothetical protein AGMMS49546_00700 [Spirochaetia bacterium]|nr:hypothetical protein AGMMS49546_00700 [Spirochaetia bacterium]
MTPEDRIINDPNASFPDCVKAVVDNAGRAYALGQLKIERIKASETIRITGKEISDTDDKNQLKKAALKYGIAEKPNEDIQAHPDVEKYQYYIIGLNIGTFDYTVKAVVSVSRNGKRYYDHKLSKIEKGLLLSTIQDLSMSSEESKKALSIIKDKRLLDILQEEIIK